MQDQIVVQEYSLADFTFKVSSLVQQGYIPSEENEGYPMQLGMLYTCNMLKIKPNSLSKAENLAVELNNLLDENTKIMEKSSDQQEIQPEAKTRGQAKKV